MRAASLKSGQMVFAYTGAYIYRCFSKMRLSSEIKKIKFFSKGGLLSKKIFFAQKPVLTNFEHESDHFKTFWEKNFDSKILTNVLQTCHVCKTFG